MMKTRVPMFLSALLLVGAGGPQVSVADAGSDPAAQRPRIPPGWGNAERVCDNPRIGNDSPRLSGRGGSNEFPTGFYRIGRLPAGDDEIFLDIDGKDPSAVIMKPAQEESARRWLITGVGAGLYQISTCLNATPKCLELAVEGKFEGFPRLQECHYEALGTQVWWSVGFIVGDTAGGYGLGNDGLGRMDCLDLSADDSDKLRIMPCGEDTRDVVWRVLPAPEPAVEDKVPSINNVDKQLAPVKPIAPRQPKKGTKPVRKTL